MFYNELSMRGLGRKLVKSEKEHSPECCGLGHLPKRESPLGDENIIEVPAKFIKRSEP